MKKLWMATTVALVAVTIALLTMAYKPGVNEPKQILTVKVYQGYHKSLTGIFVTQPDGSQEVIEIPTYASRDIAEANKKTAITLNKIVSQGYTLTSSAGGNAESSYFELYVFEK